MRNNETSIRTSLFSEVTQKKRDTASIDVLSIGRLFAFAIGDQECRVELVVAVALKADARFQLTFLQVLL